jgi:quercetin dioxygenase-like cupin family protein
MFYTANNAGFIKVLDGVERKTLVHGERTLLGEFRFAKDAVVPIHRHPQEQTGYLVAGKMRFTVNDDVMTAAPGDSWSIAANVPHGAEALEASVVIEVFAPVREDYLP